MGSAFVLFFFNWNWPGGPGRMLALPLTVTILSTPPG